MLASLFACSIIVNLLSINTLQLTKYSYKAIEYLRNLLEFNGSLDAHLNLQNESSASC